MSTSAKKLLVLVLVLVAGGIFAYTYHNATVYTANPNEIDTGLTPGASTTLPVLGNPATSSNLAGVPVRIRIAKIDMNANVVDVGLGKTGNMAVPLTFSDVGWYRYGPKPGEVGSAVIDGHVNNGLGVAAVFARLSELKAGDDIYIDTKAGDTLHFVVEESDVYDVSQVPRERLFNQSDAPRLNLVTCEGEWQQDQKMYNERRVVYAVLSPE